MNNYETALKILEILKQNKLEAYIIGGYPRDLYLNKTSQDIDICTNAKYKQLKKIFGEIEDNKYGSYKLKYNNYEYEITTYRKETKYIKNRFPKIKYVKKLKQDLKRRDFIINTLCIDKDGNYIDLLNAKEDIDNKIIRLVRKKNSLEQDALRILRALRFATILNFKIDKKLEKAILKYKHLLLNISNDRKKQELTKMFQSENISYGIKLLRKYELEKYLKIDLTNLVITNNLNSIWAQITIDESYNFTKQEKKEIKIYKNLINKKYNSYDLYKYGPEIFKTVNKIKKENINIEDEYNKLPIKDREDININFLDISKIIDIKYNNINEIISDIEKEIIEKKLMNKKSSIQKYILKKYKHTL